MNLVKKIAVSFMFGVVALMPVAVMGAVETETPPSQYGSPKPTEETYFNFKGADDTQDFKLPGVAKTDPRAIISNLISIVSGFLGIIAVVIVLMSGFQWMTAGGDEEAIKKAQQRLIQGIIGLILILSTWSIAYYVVNTVSKSIFGS